MKKNIKHICIIFIFLMGTVIVSGQTILRMDEVIVTDLSGAEEEMVKTLAQQLITDYENYASLKNLDMEVGYYDLFDNNALVLNDLESKVVKKEITIENYADKSVFAANVGFDFKLKDAVLTELYKERGVFKGVILVKKEIESQINEESVLVKLNSPKEANLTLNFTVDPFDPESAKINGISGDIKGVEVVVDNSFRLPADNNISIDITRGILGGMAGMAKSNVGFSDTNADINASVNLGLAVNYRKGLFREVDRPVWYLLMGLSFQSLSVNTDISSFAGSYETNGDFILTRITTLEQNLGGLEQFGENSNKTINLNILSISDNAKEELSLSVLTFSIGLEYKLIKKSADGLFGGLKINGHFLTAGSGQTNGQIIASNIPKDADFPVINDLNDFPDNDDLRDLYTISTSENSITPSSNLSFSVSPFVRYQKMITRKIGYEVGGEYVLGVTPFFKSQEITSGKEFLNGSPTDRPQTVLEDYFESTKFRSLNINLGIVYLLN